MALDRDKEVNTTSLTMDFNLMCVGTALVNMYSRCGSVRDARLVFDKLGKRDVISCHALIGGLAFYRYGQEALQIF